MWVPRECTVLCMDGPPEQEDGNEAEQPLRFRELRKRNERYQRAHRERIDRLIEVQRERRRRRQQRPTSDA